MIEIAVADATVVIGHAAVRSSLSRSFRIAVVRPAWIDIGAELVDVSLMLLVQII